MKLYSFFRSSTSHRLRIALSLKGLVPGYIPVDLRVDEQTEASFKTLNPQGLVPVLKLDDGRTLIQSPAIIEWLEECHPEPALLPRNVEDRAHVRAMANRYPTLRSISVSTGDRPKR
jgi:maleylpyruvate isomerase